MVNCPGPPARLPGCPLYKNVIHCNEKLVYFGYTGWRNKNVPNFRTALCNRVIKINEVTNTYSVSKHLRISLKFFA